MDTKTLVKALKTAVREVIKEELTEILREGLQSTVNEMKHPAKSDTVRVPPRMVSESGNRSKVQFNENKWASVLNETEALIEQGPSVMNSLVDLMNEGYEHRSNDTPEMSFTSADARGFGAMRQSNFNVHNNLQAPSVMEDPEDGKTYQVAPEVQQALTRDYSALMKAINKKKGS